MPRPPTAYRPPAQVVYVPVAMPPVPRRRRRSKENRIYTAIAVLMLLGIAGVYLLPRFMQASRNDAEARNVATTYEGLIQTRIANDLPGNVVSIDLSANLASVELDVEIEDGVLNGRLGAMGVRSMIEMTTGQALDLIVVTLITPTDRSTWRWSTLNKTWRES
ncbi:MAG: hypothetical protein IPM16_06610 [Chloroflexi bacterium]|nr:hypothetical protein [Chloroflexota bacterium]